MTLVLRPLPCLRLVVLMALLGAACAAGAVQRALLVGVSELSNQPPALWLQAPRNDVVLMRQALLKQGFGAADITVLADGVSGAALPDAQRIHEALARLLEQSRPGDFVALYFSGHGTRLRDTTKRYQEPDGLAENFLARDVRGAIGTDIALAGGVRDVDFDAWIKAFLARDVFVWSVFDTCSAASMTRGAARTAAIVAGPPDDEVRFRGVRVDQLAAGAAGLAAAAAGAGVPPASPSVPRARYVAFFASESHQVTPELRLPRKDRAARPQGLLTWAVAEALQRRPATWRDLFNGVLSLYPPVIEELEVRFPERELPSPVAEGNLDLPLFQNSAAPVSTRPVWPARRAGSNLVLEVGQLDGLEAQQALRVLATLADGTVRSASARLAVAPALASTRIDVPPTLADLPGAALWSVTPAEEPGATALRVATDKALPAGISLPYPTAIRAVRDGEGEIDVRWRDLGAAGHRLDIVSPALAMLAGAPKDGLLLPDPEALRRRLETLARFKWFTRLSAMAADSQLAGFEATLEVWSGERLLRSEPLRAASQLQPPAERERATLMVRNTSGQSLDLVILGVGAQGALAPVYPAEVGETNRFERGTRDAPAAKRFDLPGFGADPGARLLVLASAALPQSAPRLFGVGVTEALSDLRVRGQLAPDKERQVFAAIVQWGAAGTAPTR